MRKRIVDYCLKKFRQRSDCNGQIMKQKTFQKQKILKSQMAMKNILMFFVIVMAVFLLGDCKKNKNGNSTINTIDIYQDAFVYRGEKPAITDVTIIEDGTEYLVKAFSGQVIVYFEEGVGLASAKQIINNLNGEIIEQIPSLQYYLVKVIDGKENDFVSNIYSQGARYAFPNILLSNCSVAVIDDFSTGNNHGNNVKSAINNCGSSATKIDDFDIGFIGSDGDNYVDPVKAYNYITSLMVGKSIDGTPLNSVKEPILINLSFGPIEISSTATEQERITYIRKWQDMIAKIIIRINKLDKSFQKNYVITMAAGNSQLQDFYKQIIEPMFESNYKGRILSKSEQEILKNNLLIVTAIDDRYPPYSNKSSNGDPVAAVDISKTSLPNGTSFAAPTALCYISQIMELKKNNGNNLTPVEALAAVKKAVKNNAQGEFVLDEALSVAGDMYSIKQPIITSLLGQWESNESFDNDGDFFTNKTIITLMSNGIASHEGISIQGKWSVIGNSITLSFEWSKQDDGHAGYNFYTYTYKGTVNSASNEIKGNGTIHLIMTWDDGGTPDENNLLFSFTMTKNG
jgi:hypothetical protein